jgi:hypothetical protein
MFTFKCYFKLYPGTVYVLLFVLSTIICAFLAQIIELPYNNIPLVTQGLSYDISYMGNAIYFIIMTITTVGYGDLSPNTPAGKILAIGCALWGSTLVSLLVVTQMGMFELSHNQTKALSHIKMSEHAADTINQSARLFLIRKKKLLYDLQTNPEEAKKSKFLQQVIEFNKNRPPALRHESLLVT